MIVILIIAALLAVWLTSMVAATVYISESNGAGEVVTDNITNINFGSVDTPNIVAANHPIIQGENSFSKWLRFKVQSLGTSTTIKDLRYWKSAGVYVAGEFIKHANTQTAGGSIGYATPSQTFIGGTYGNQSISNGDPGTAIVGIGGNLAGTIIAAPNYSDYFLMQLITNSGGITPVGPVNQKTITFQFDEQ